MEPVTGIHPFSGLQAAGLPDNNGHWAPSETMEKP